MTEEKERDGAGAEAEAEAGDDRPPVYVEENGLVVYRASALGGCSASLLEYRIGDNEPAPHPQWLLDRFESGKRNESVILGLLYDAKWGRPWKSVGGSQLEVELPVGENVVVRGHLDDLAMKLAAINDTFNAPVGEIRVVEAKKFGPSYMDTWQRKGLSGFPLYEFQLSIYMHATGKRALFVVGVAEADEKDPDNRAADVVRKIEILEVDEPPVSEARIKLKVARIEAMFQKRQRFEQCDVDQYPCPWYVVLHDGKNQPPVQRDWELEGRLRASAQLELLNTPAEMMMRGKRMEAEGKGLQRQGQEFFDDWFRQHPEIKDEEIRTKRWVIKRNENYGVWAIKPRLEHEIGEQA